jgi:pimeloyl-ACP methyl ester carboxylesterase
MKLPQRIFLQYYSTKFRLLDLISPSQAAKRAFELFCTPYSKRRTYQAPGAFKHAQKLTFLLQDQHIRGFYWQPEVSNGHKVLICHGFNSYSYKFERYINPLLREGFEVFAFDAPAHGTSAGKTIHAILYRDMILEVSLKYGPFDSIIAHSFAGLAVMLAVEKMMEELPKQLVLIAPATETTRSVDDFCRHLKIRNKLREELEQLIIQIGGQQASWYSVARVIQSISISTMWLHDAYDPITPYDDMRHLRNLNLSHVEFVITEGLGHSLYMNDEIANKIIGFLSVLKNPQPNSTRLH